MHVQYCDKLSQVSGTRRPIQVSILSMENIPSKDRGEGGVNERRAKLGPRL